MFKRLLESDLSSVTKNNYIQILQKLENELKSNLLDILLHPTVSIPKINKLSNNPSSIRTFYVAILAFFKYDKDLKEIMYEYENWVKEFDKWNKIYLNNSKMNKPSQKQVASYLPFKEIQGKLESLKVGSDERMILAMYTLIPPLRSDYGKLRIYYNHLPQNPETNYLLLKVDSGRISIGNHKTFKSIGTVLQKIPDELFKEIKKFLEVSGSKQYLFENRIGVPFEKNDFAKYVSRKLTHIFEKPMSINTLRHSYINSMDFNTLSIQEKEQIAEKMGHGLFMQDRYRLLM